MPSEGKPDVFMFIDMPLEVLLKAHDRAVDTMLLCWKSATGNGWMLIVDAPQSTVAQLARFSSRTRG